MRKRELAKLIGMLAGLTHDQRKVVVAELSAAENRVAAVDIIEGRFPVRPRCPHCNGECTVRNGHANGLQRHKCRQCGKTFNALTGTPLARLHLRGKWLAQAAALRDGLSLNQIADHLVIAQSTAFRGYAEVEAAKLGIEGRGFLAFLEGAKVLTPLLREIIIERAMALSEDNVSIEKLKVIVLMVLWSQQHSIDSLVLEELLADRAQLLMH